ncbi:diguanylate cyclase [Brevundimonas sp.]|uniref:diguanylate cyclase domain-containing protein n=1 Tax=Brevundimonas sp. TaxID=1871086 RepID=UPI0025EEBF2C|nr:diguanylate cyclase [Brevundimonas sp.]
MQPRARVLLLAAEDDLAGPLADGLDPLGWGTVTARTVETGERAVADLEIEAVIVDARVGDPQTVGRLKGAAGARRLPVLALGGPAPAADLLMAPPVQPAQAALRRGQLGRAAVTGEELELRRQTFEERGQQLAIDTARGPSRVLAVGEPDPRFLALSNVLEQRQVELTAALTPYTAFDYLHEREFDAVLLWGGEKRAEALSIASGIKRNTRLYHLPVVLYVRSDAEMNLSEVFNRGVADIASPDAPVEETADRVLALSDAFRRHNQVREALEKARHSGLMDPTTGLFTRELFAAHLARLSHASSVRARPLSVCVLRVADRGAVAEARKGGWVDRAMPQIGAMISRLVRAEDTAARLSPETFALALPATRLGQARLVSERIAAVIGCTAFHAGEDKTPFVVEFDIGEAERMPTESPVSLLERAALNARTPTA